MDLAAQPVAEELGLEHPAESADYFTVERAPEELLLRQPSQRPRAIHIYHVYLDLPLPLLDVFLGFLPLLVRSLLSLIPYLAVSI